MTDAIKTCFVFHFAGKLAKKIGGRGAQTLVTVGKRGGLVVERRTPEREVRGSILTQVAVLCP